MSDKHIDPNEINRQKKIAQEIKKENQRLGRQPKACVITYGCQQNENDSERLKGMLSEMGYQMCQEKEQADLILFNTCAVRENAEFKARGNVGALKYLKAKKKDLLIGVCGCMVQQKQEADYIHSKFHHVDMVFGTHSLYRFPEILQKAKQKPVVDVMDCDGFIAEDLPVKRDDANKAWVTIMYGCNNFCTYCIVPYVRGRERSRDPKDVLKEIRMLAEDGYQEVTLLGQNVNSYGKDLEDGISFAQLLREVNEIEGIKRIRFATSHPKDISRELICAMAECDKVCKQLHLPFQAGSNRILKLMNRSYTREQYLETIRLIREKMPDIALSSDVIVGFPGETDEDFEQTIKLVEEVKFDALFTFIYSKRAGTKAAAMEQTQSDEEIQRNFERLLEVQNKISRKINETYQDRILSVFVDGISKTDPQMLQGRTESNKVVNFKGGEKLIGTFVPIRITQVRTWSLNGELA